MYNQCSIKAPGTGNPLQDLLPGDCEHGWHVARNLIKPLNHLGSLRRKELIAADLNLHNTRTPPRWFDANYAMLANHQARKVPTADLIDHLARQLHQVGRPLTAAGILDRLRDYATIQHMEFHPSDVCNLTCCGCTYGHDDPDRRPLPISFPFHEIKTIAQMKPRSMVIIGGGEPALYRSGKHGFQEVVDEICSTNPGIALALVTNGTHKPPGDWPNRFSWIRLSLDAATEETYSAFRGKPMFDRVIQNFLDYLDHDVRYVGISFLFARSNVRDYAAVARFIFALVRKKKPNGVAQSQHPVPPAAA